MLAQQKQGLNLWSMSNIYFGSTNCAMNHFLNWLKSFSFINIPWSISKIKLFSESLEPIKLWLLQMLEFLWETRLVKISFKDWTWWLEMLKIAIAIALQIFIFLIVTINCSCSSHHSYDTIHLMNNRAPRLNHVVQIGNSTIQALQ